MSKPKTKEATGIIRISLKMKGEIAKNAKDANLSIPDYILMQRRKISDDLFRIDKLILQELTHLVNCGGDSERLRKAHEIIEPLRKCLSKEPR